MSPSCTPIIPKCIRLTPRIHQRWTRRITNAHSHRGHRSSPQSLVTVVDIQSLLMSKQCPPSTPVSRRQPLYVPTTPTPRSRAILRVVNGHCIGRKCNSSPKTPHKHINFLVEDQLELTRVMLHRLGVTSKVSHKRNSN